MEKSVRLSACFWILRGKVRSSRMQAMSVLNERSLGGFIWVDWVNPCYVGRRWFWQNLKQQIVLKTSSETRLAESSAQVMPQSPVSPSQQTPGTLATTSPELRSTQWTAALTCLPTCGVLLSDQFSPLVCVIVSQRCQSHGFDF